MGGNLIITPLNLDQSMLLCTNRRHTTWDDCSVSTSNLVCLNKCLPYPGLEQKVLHLFLYFCSGWLCVNVTLTAEFCNIYL